MRLLQSSMNGKVGVSICLTIAGTRMVLGRAYSVQNRD